MATLALKSVLRMSFWVKVMNDPIVAEVRSFRDEHAKQFNYDLDAICSDLISRQERRDHPLVSRKNKNKPAATHTANALSARADRP